jgi:DNA (cytosine-5)-methyltransferase 1
MSNNKATYVDLFAGIGGFAAALHALGAENHLASEFDPAAASVYQANWGRHAFSDVTVIAPDVRSESNPGIGDHDILTAGFPCQPFSKSGSQLGVLDASRGTLFHNILNAIQTGKPAMVVLENVRNLAGPRHAKDLRIIIESLRELGYRVSDEHTFVSPHRIHPDLGGRPQSRERLFIVATKVPSGLSTSLEAEKLDVYGNLPIDWKPDEWRASEFLDKSPKASESSAITKSESVVLACWNDFVQRLRANSIRVPAFPIWTEYWGLSPQPSEFPAWKWSLVEKNLNFYAENRVLLDSWASTWSFFSSSDFSPSKRKFEWQAGDMAKVLDGIIQFRPSGVRVKKPTYLPALVAITQTPIIGPLNRRLTVKDAATLQGLPDTFSFGRQVESKSFKQLGNGVNVGVAWWVIRTAILRDMDLLSKTEQGQRILELYRASETSPDSSLANFEPLGEQH